MGTVSQKRGKVKGRRVQPPFLSLPSHMLRSPEWAALSSFEIKLLVDMASQYSGSNNGDLGASWAVMKARGWRSPGTLNKALRGLRVSGFVVMTRQGGLHQCSLFAITWRGIDDCRGKHDAAPNTVPSNLWKLENRSSSRVAYQGSRVVYLPSASDDKKAA